ncbi:MAG: DUF1064 domain-containing protein [Candidatus Rhabdochlamydia sp.]
MKKLGINNKVNILTTEEKREIKELYSLGFKRGDGKMKALSEKLGRTRPFISRYAKSLGYTNRFRSCDEQIIENISIRNKKWFSENAHPKGMLGKKHSKEMAKKIGARLKNYYNQLTPGQKSDKYCRMVETQRDKGVYNRKHGSWSSAWRSIGGKTKFFRSTWEANYARYLEYLKENGKIKDWEHEPQTFWFLKIMRGARSYLPDFKVTNLDGSHYWVEVKGWMDSKSKTKIKRFKKYYPEETLILIQGPWFKANTPGLKNLLTGWEYLRGF